MNTKIIFQGQNGRREKLFHLLDLLQNSCIDQMNCGVVSGLSR